MADRKKGFSLIELLIVVAIILIIASIAVPNLIRAKIAANQSSAVSSLRTIDSSSVIYHNTYQDGYPGSLGVLAPAAPPSCNAADLIDGVLASAGVPPGKSGYTFTWQIGADQILTPPTGCAAGGYADMFSVTAAPNGFPTGTTYYCVDATGVIRQGNAPVNATPAGCDPNAMAVATN